MTTPIPPPDMIKDEPRTPVRFPTSPYLQVKDKSLDGSPTTPQKSVRSPSSSRIGSSPGSMSMSQRRGVKPSFPGARTVRPGGTNVRGLLTPQQSGSSRQPPYPSPIPLISAPLSPPPGTPQRWHQSAPAAPMASPKSQQGIPHPNTYQVSLDEIPKDFVLKKLVQLASKYWYAPHSADCHIIVPIKRVARSPTIPSTPRTAVPPLHPRRSTQPHVPQTANNENHTLHARPGDSFLGPTTPTAASIRDAARGALSLNGEEDVKPDVLSSSVQTLDGARDFTGRRGSLPGGNQLEQCLVFPLHRDYLTTQSILFRTLLNSPAAHLSHPPPRDFDGRLLFQSPVIRGAKVLPTKADKPKALYVPLPDPASFGVLLHWLYWHDADHFNHCLSKGLVTWQGVIRNIEYLSLDNEVKLLAGKWWKRWIKPIEPTERRRGKTGVASSRASGKRRALSTSAAKTRDIGKMVIDHHDDEEDEEDEDFLDGDGEGSDSGDEADDEDIGINVNRQVDGGIADHVSLKLGQL
ncbi:uncharacterized protein IL334_005719 [Kwoniella shivajii]|uniref:BTB domain-containing protein n=1 Tax=Kwoniella shivajii TaxID=564305 RepID=A0ABZ1D3X4_9TREE|nr:hypothetical protein IL334_005719 [Kwoniella shivajii]